MSAIKYGSLLLVICLLGCGNSEDKASVPGSAGKTPPKIAKNPEPGQPFLLDGDYAASHLLVAYAGARGAGPEVTRLKNQAQSRAEELLSKLRADPAGFDGLASTESDGASRSTQGDLGSWKKGQMPAVVEAALDQIRAGAIYPKVVETEFGFHLLRRNSRLVPHFGGYACFIAFKGNPQNPPTIKREKAEAEALAQKFLKEAHSDNFFELAKKQGDLFSGAQFLGGIPKNSQTAPQILAQLEKLAYGEVGGPIEVPGSFAIVMRTKLEQLAGSHILIAFKGAKNAPPSLTLDEKAAEAKARELIAELKKQPARYAELAKSASDSSAGSVGGDLGVWFRGSMIPGFDEVLVKLNEGQIADIPLRSEFGYHIIRRNSLSEIPAEEVITSKN